MDTRHLALSSLLLTLTAGALGCGPCVDDGRRGSVPGPGGPVIVAADMCDGEAGGTESESASSDGSGDSTAPTADASDGGASETGSECPFVPCDMNGGCPAGTGTCMQDQCLITCPCQADPGECAVSFGGPVTFCPAEAAPTCG